VDKELETYYNNFFDLFRNEGWKQLHTELVNNINVINNVNLTKDEQDLFFRKGQLAVIANLVNLEETINSAYKEIIESNEDA
jgi:hypothetical protein